MTNINLKIKNEDMIGRRFGRLTVLKEGPKNKFGHITFYCQCDCGKIKIVRKGALLQGMTLSCGCLVTDNNRKKKQPFNEYEIIDKGKTVKIFDKKHNFALIDADDLELVKSYGPWHQNGKGYWVTRIYYGTGKKNGQEIQLHRIVNNAKKGEIIDHINRKPYDNRKINLRKVSTLENAHNFSIYSTNTSGFTGVRKTKYNKWATQIKNKGKQIYVGTYKTKEEAFEARKYAEFLLWGEHGAHSENISNEVIKKEVERLLYK